jgi:hypothetical protein
MNLSSQLKAPYLKIIFGILATEGDWMTALNNTDLPLTESIAVALRFLSDEDLIDFASKRAKRMAVQGRLEGVF